MKHIFTIHSPITYLSALGVITKLNLKEEDCLIYSLYFEMDKPIQTHTRANPSLLFKLKHFWGRINIGGDLYKTVSEFVKDDVFSLYAPCMVREAVVMANHPKCVKRNFIEEGLSSYYQGYKFESINSYFTTDKISYSFFGRLKESIKMFTLSMRGFSGKIIGTPLYYTSYINSQGIDFYSFSENSFPLCSQNKHLLSFGDISTRFDVKPTLKIDNHWIFISEYQFDGTSVHDFVEGVEKGFLPKLKQNNINEIFIKFHPAESDNSQKSLLNLFVSHKIKCNVIDKKIIMEFEMMWAKNIKVYGYGSTLLVYAAMMGHDSNSIIEHTPNYPEIPVPIFHKMVKK